MKALDYVTLLDYSHMELSDEIIPSDEAVQSQIDKTLSSYTKIPCSTLPNSFRHSSKKYSYKRSASDGEPACVKLGRLPFLQSAYSVNCDTTSTSPPTSSIERFIFPSSSEKNLAKSSMVFLEQR